MIQAQFFYGLPFILTGTGAVYGLPSTVAGIIVSSHTAGTLKLWDSLAGSGTVLVDTFTFPAGSGSYSFHGVKATTGIFATVGGSLSATLVYNPFRG